MDTIELAQAFDDFVAVAETGGFGAPRDGGWDAPHVLAHVHAVNAHIASTALAIRAGLRVVYDNRPTLDEWNLRRIIAAAGSTAALIDLVRRDSVMYRAVAENLDDRDLEMSLHIFIVSDNLVMVDEPLPLLWLVTGVGEIHLPRHAAQLSDLRG